MCDVSFSMLSISCRSSDVFFFNDTATTEIYTLSLHDALPISGAALQGVEAVAPEELVIAAAALQVIVADQLLDRKSTRLNSSHQIISYAVFCLKKKNTEQYISPPSQTYHNH